MEAAISDGEVLIGSVLLDHLDPPMGVAIGRFRPSGRYSAYLHANTVNGEFFGYKGEAFSVRIEGHQVEIGAVAIDDWMVALAEIQASIHFRDERQYASIFRGHPDFDAYWGSSERDG